MAVDELSGLGRQIRLSCKGADGLAAAVQGVRGVERLLTSAVDSLLVQLNRYSTLSEIILSGIERIESKRQIISDN